MTEIIQKEFRPVNLMKPTAVFVEVPNICFYADAQVIAKLMIVMEQAEDIRQMFAPMFQTFKDKNFTEIVNALEEKRDSTNILHDYVDWGVAKEETDDVIRYCNDVYKSALYFMPQIEVPFVPTVLGNAIRVISKDKSLTKLYLYMEHKCSPIEQEMSKLFWMGGSLCEWIIGGDIRTAITQANADIYFLYNFQSIEGIFSIKEIRHREVFTPAYPFNMNLYSPFIKKDSPDAEVGLYSKFDIDVNFVKTPI